MSHVKPLPAGHYRLGYAEKTTEELLEAMRRIETFGPYNYTTADLVDLMIIRGELDRRNA